MGDKLVLLGDHANNAFMVTPDHPLKSALDDIGSSGALEKGTKVLVLALDDTDGSYSISYYQAGMKTSECISLIELAKSMFMENMGY